MSPDQELGAIDAAEIGAVLDDVVALLLLLPPSSEEPKVGVARPSATGDLAGVPLAALLAMFEMERTTGRLILARGRQTATLHVREGRVVDAEPLGVVATARARVATTLAWEDGTFALYLEPVERPDRVGASTTHLLLDFARERDEESALNGVD